MNITKYTIYLLTASLLACSSPRTGSSPGKSNSKRSFGKRNYSKVNTQELQKPDKDTTVINLLTAETEVTNNSDSDGSIGQNKVISPEIQIFNSAMDKFSAGKYAEALKKFNEFTAAYSASDDRFQEAKFYIAECLIQRKKYDTAVENFTDILNSGTASSEVMQQTLVRLGQVFCLQSKKNLAEQAFSRLRREYPNSDYLPLASCD